MKRIWSKTPSAHPVRKIRPGSRCVGGNRIRLVTFPRANLGGCTSLPASPFVLVNAPAHVISALKFLLIGFTQWGVFPTRALCQFALCGSDRADHVTQFKTADL